MLSSLPSATPTQAAVSLSLAFIVPLLLIAYKSRNSASASTTEPGVDDKEEEEEEKQKKPLRSIMQPANADLLPPKDDPFTVEELKEYDGSTEGKPIYVAIKGDIFDVTKKADVYGAGRSYNIFAGKDGSRGLGMSSLKTEHAVADYSTLTDAEMAVLNEWHSFFSKRYNIIGKLVDGYKPPTANM